ncbi:MAG: aminodeoxychorismate synthase component I [Acidiferrobacterales bacterium]|nr:aminodeoxychorismate synthase component I [Acidiferrobacterales bacterium]
MSITVEQFNYLDGATLFAQIANQKWAQFLDSGVIDGRPPVTKHADYDVLAMQPIITLVSDNDATLITKNGDLKKAPGDPLTLLQEHLAEFDFDQQMKNSSIELAALPPYMPGALGYFSYDLARRYEDLPNLALDEEQLPDMAMGIYSSVVVIDHRAKATFLVSLQSEAYESQVSDLQNEWRLLIENQQNLAKTESIVRADKYRSGEMSENLSYHEYQHRFDKVRHYIVAGDCYQVNLAKQFSTQVAGDGWSTYHYLREISPAPYGAYMNFPFAQVLSNSPESFIQCRERKVVTSPIKGTRARIHHDKNLDKAIAQELYNSPKDRAENLMIVDLMRNDLSRCCELGSVKVPKLFALHSFANVHHLISTVTGTLKQGAHSLDLLRSCFPGGSITGAPKIRAMQVIEELEPHRRGLYCGAISYIGFDGNMETNIAIRTIVVKDHVARYSAGGGLVIDSNVDEEYQEVADKAKMMTEVIFG